MKGWSLNLATKKPLKQPIGAPMAMAMMITAQMETPEGTRTGSVFLQNAETIRLVRPDGTPVSVVALRPGDEVICRSDVAGRHFGMRIQENIREI